MLQTFHDLPHETPDPVRVAMEITRVNQVAQSFVLTILNLNERENCSKRTSQEEQNGANFSLIAAASSEEDPGMSAER